MKKRNLILLLLFMLLICTSCGNKNEEKKDNPINFETKNNEVKEKENKILSFMCDNKKIKLETPNSWTEYKEDKINNDACLELIGVDEYKYLIIISEEKSSFSSFSSWFDEAYNSAKQAYELDDSKLRRTDEGGLNTRFIEKDLEMEGQKMYMQLYFVETNNYYNQLLLWTNLDNKTLYNVEFRDIAYTLKEVE